MGNNQPARSSDYLKQKKSFSFYSTDGTASEKKGKTNLLYLFRVATEEE